MKKAEEFSRMVKALRQVLELWEQVAPEYERMMGIVEEGETALAQARQEREAELALLKGKIDALTHALETKRVETKAAEAEMAKRVTDAEARALKAQAQADTSQREASTLMTQLTRDHAQATSDLLAERARLQQDVDGLRRVIAASKKQLAELKIEV